MKNILITWVTFQLIVIGFLQLNIFQKQIDGTLCDGIGEYEELTLKAKVAIVSLPLLMFIPEPAIYQKCYE